MSWSTSTGTGEVQFWSLAIHNNSITDKLTIHATSTSAFNMKDEVQLKVDGTAVWGGYVSMPGKFDRDGRQWVEVLQYGGEICENVVVINEEDKSPEYIIGQALSGTGYTLVTPVATGITVRVYNRDDKIGTVFNDMCDRTGYVLRFTPELDGSDKKVYFEPKGQNSSGETYTTESGGGGIRFGDWYNEVLDGMWNKVRVHGEGVIAGLDYDDDFVGCDVTGTCTNPSYSNDDNTSNYSVFTAGDLVTWDLGDFYYVTRYRNYGHDDNLGYTIYFLVLYRDQFGEWYQVDNTFQAEGDGWGDWKYRSFYTDTIRVVCWYDDSIPGGAKICEFHFEGEYEGWGQIIGEAEDSGSIGTYGEQFKSLPIDYMVSQAEADQIAESLLQPEPHAGGTVSMPWNESIMINQTCTLYDALRNVNDTFVVEEQKINSHGSMVLKLGWANKEGYINEIRRYQAHRKDVAKAMNLAYDSVMADTTTGVADNYMDGGVDPLEDFPTMGGDILDDNPQTGGGGYASGPGGTKSDIDTSFSDLPDSGIALPSDFSWCLVYYVFEAYRNSGTGGTYLTLRLENTSDTTYMPSSSGYDFYIAEDKIRYYTACFLVGDGWEGDNVYVEGKVSADTAWCRQIGTYYLSMPHHDHEDEIAPVTDEHEHTDDIDATDAGHEHYYSRDRPSGDGNNALQ